MSAKMLVNNFLSEFCEGSLNRIFWHSCVICCIFNNLLHTHNITKCLVFVFQGVK